MVSTGRNAGLLLMTVACLLANYGEATCIGKTMLRSGGISCEEKQIILDEHNRLRQLVALGQIHGQPSAANMMEMIWDDELAAIAQRWADRCAESHDSLRNVRRFAVGQNMARSWTTRPPGPYDGESNWRRQISGWFNEVQYYHSGYSRATGHYTQLVWGDTFLLGCGYSFYYDPARGYTKNYVCNYGPSGNVLGFQPYKSGQPSCGNYGMSYSNRYSGLCFLLFPEHICEGVERELSENGNITCDIIRDVLDTHNRIRQSIAEGSINSQPPAANMRELYWDPELASGAQNWANQCPFAHNDAKDRKVERFEVGQNIGLTRI